MEGGAWTAKEGGLELKQDAKGLTLIVAAPPARLLGQEAVDVAERLQLSTHDTDVCWMDTPYGWCVPPHTWHLIGFSLLILGRWNHGTEPSAAPAAAPLLPSTMN